MTLTITNTEEDASAYEAALARFQRLYDKCTLSGSPKLEIASAGVLTVLAIGILLAVVVRLGSDLSADFGWLMVIFMGTLVYHLMETSSAVPFMLEEALLRAAWRHRRSRRIVLLTKRRVLIREFACVFAFVVMLALLVWGVYLLINGYFPPPWVRHVTYTAGG